MKQDFVYNSPVISRDNILKNITNSKEKLIIAGPCTFASYEELYEIAVELKKLGINFIRAGAYKGRTNPYSFQGLQDEGIEILIKIKNDLNLKIVTELMTTEQIKKYGNQIDVIQVGSRNMYNYELLKELGLSATYEEFLLASEYILKCGNHNVILCERGIRSINSNETRNVLDIQAIAYIKKHSNLPIIIDPSHASGKSYMVESMSKASLIAGADGLIIETHISPEKSLCDSEQTINIEQLKNILKFNERIDMYED